MNELASVPVLRIHGDNVVECERALRLIARGLGLESTLGASPIFFPCYLLTEKNIPRYKVELLAGHSRWYVDLQNVLCANGAPLHEATDAIVTRLDAEGIERLVLALEFSSALPAGNNAWQRHGRALSCVTAQLPYLYFAEIGGVELSANRSAKAARFPNPIVPFSYVMADRLYASICVPVYSASAAAGDEIRAGFSLVFGETAGVRLLRALLLNEETQTIHAELTARALWMAELLAGRRKRADTWRGEDWAKFLACDSTTARMNWLSENPKAWQRKNNVKVRTSESFRALQNIFSSIGCFSIGAGDIPICWLATNQCELLAQELAALYGAHIPIEIITWLKTRQAPLFIVWATGFKPNGEDSRPDRGLLPLMRMLFGYQANIMTIVSGPAKSSMWKQLRDNSPQLAKQNGLWEAILGLSNIVLADSATLSNPLWVGPKELNRTAGQRVSFTASSAPQKFSEQDVDTALHLLFSRVENSAVFEGLCNPPGGDWSGLSLIDWQTRVEYRWTSLPRVSESGGKRPDHVIQFKNRAKTVLLSIESKTKANSLEARIGPRLAGYVQQLIQSAPTTSRTPGHEWNAAKLVRFPVRNVEFISGGAFIGTPTDDFAAIAQRAQIDIVFAFEFHSGEQPSLLRVFVNLRAQFLLPVLRELAGNLNGRLEIQVG